MADNEETLIGDFYLNKEDWARIREHNTPEWRAENRKRKAEERAAKEKEA